ncbi:hypothetical protein ACPPVT_12520 [Angustibacter sp. McL0619]|uniref:hypothetical protein n=1 Tax=Angustibacter sp. McL0619 TaxID=3415676 RepID=UPI003CF8317C
MSADNFPDVPFFTTGGRPPVLAPPPASLPAPQGSGPAGRRSRFSNAPRAAGLVAAVIATVLLAVVGWRATHRPNLTPVVLPDSFASYGPLQDGVDFAKDDGPTSWRTSAKGTLGGNAFDGRAFGNVRSGGPMLNVVVARTDLTDKLDVALAAPPYTMFGSVTCTQTVDLASAARKRNQTPKDLPGPRFNARSVLCWRATDDVSVSAFGLLASADLMPRVAAAVDEVWELQ